MQYFYPTLYQILTFLGIIFVGYFVCKKGLISSKSDHTLSKLLSLVMLPALCFKTFCENLTVENITKKLPITLYGLLALALSFTIGVGLCFLFSKIKYTRYIYAYSFTIANMSYFGYSLIGAVFGNKVLADMMMFTLPFNIFTYTAAYTVLTESKKFSFKSLLNPVCVSLLLGAAVGLSGIKLPVFITSFASSLGSCMGPVAMLLAGVSIAKYDLKKMLLNLPVFIASVLRLAVIPAVLVLVFKLIGAPDKIIIILLGTTAMPLGLNTVVFPASCGRETDTGASMALISNMLCIITIPLMFLLFIK